MITALVISLIVLVIGIVLASTLDSITGVAMALLGGVGVFIFFLLSMHWQITSQTLTGYAYQRQESFGYVNYDLRFSQNAGQDKQPSFCVKANSDTDKKLQEVVGTDTKIRVSIPSHGFFLAENLFTCSSEAQLVSVGAANDKQ